MLFFRNIDNQKSILGFMKQQAHIAPQKQEILMAHGLEGIDELRRLVKFSEYSQESAFGGFTSAECLIILKVCAELDLEVYPDQLTQDERRKAIRHKKISAVTRRRLYKDAGYEYVGSKDELK